MKPEVNYILEVIKHGLNYLDILMGMPVKELQEIYGAPDEVNGDLKAGYLRYESLRIGYFGDYIDEVAILFSENTCFQIQIDELEDISVIDAHTSINHFMHILNYAGLQWTSQYRKNRLDYTSIVIEGCCEAMFDLETGYIMRIAL